MNYNTVFHVDLNDEAVLNVAISNIANYYNVLENAADGKNAEIVLLVNGPAINLFVKEKTKAELVDLQKRGLKIRACQNAVNKFSLSKEKLMDEIEIVPAGIVELVRLQNEHFAYIKP